MKTAILCCCTPILGLLVMLVGFTYDVLFAGIPYQDPTPELQASYDLHSSIATGMYWAGAILFLAGLMIIPWLLKRSRKHGSADHHV